MDYEDALKAQDGVLFAQALERKALGRIRARFLNGAVDVGEKYYFDAERGIVRHRTREETGT